LCKQINRERPRDKQERFTLHLDIIRPYLEERLSFLRLSRAPTHQTHVAWLRTPRHGVLEAWGSQRTPKLVMKRHICSYLCDGRGFASVARSSAREHTQLEPWASFAHSPRGHACRTQHQISLGALDSGLIEDIKALLQWQGSVG